MADPQPLPSAPPGPRPRAIEAADIPNVHDGVFFSLAPPLPRGRHSLSREEVLLAQRERMMIAFTELVAANGYRDVTIGDVVARAGVSRAAFYECFDSKDTCGIACYDRFIEVLLTRVGAGLSASEDHKQWVASAVEGYLGGLQSDLVVARTFLVEMDAAGPRARERRRGAMNRFADVIHQRYENEREKDRQMGALPRSAQLATAYALRQLAADELEENEAPDLLSLAAEAIYWVNARDLGARLAETAASDV